MAKKYYWKPVEKIIVTKVDVNWPYCTQKSIVMFLDHSIHTLSCFVLATIFFKYTTVQSYEFFLCTLSHSMRPIGIEGPGSEVLFYI